MAGVLSAGGICSNLIGPATNDLTFVEFLDFLSAQPVPRRCVPVLGMSVCKEDQSAGVAVDLPARGPAIGMSAEDFGFVVQELAIMCRMLGKRCSYEIQTYVRAQGLM